MDDDALLRFSRQIMLPDIDVAGQELLLRSRALIIGLGGLGSPVAMYLAAAGVGTLEICDDDAVDLSNLQRQVMHTTDRIGKPKVESALKTLRALRPDIELIGRPQRLVDESLDQAVDAADVVLDCCDNFATRFAINSACHRQKTPLVSGAAIRWEGQITVFDQKPESPCYRCLYSEDAPEDESCSENGVVSPLVGIIGAMQALEAIKVLCGAGTSLSGRLLAFDGLRQQWRELRLKRDPKCPVCAT
jgi:molybdopterin/thiamine biosynthesis adenylyltransferase